MRFDVLVLGGGTAGCVLAARLSEEPSRSVCLVEAGPDYGPYADGGWPEDMVDGRQLAFSHAWETDREDRSQLRARILGGCSAHNACVVLEGAPADYDEWGPGWTYAELEPYLRRAERELRTRRQEIDEISPWHAAFAEAAGDDTILNPLNAVGQVRWNAAFAYLDPARGRPNLTIMADTLVDRVLLDGDRATGAATSAGSSRRIRSSWPQAHTGRPRSSCAAASARRAACPWEKGSQTTSGSAPPGSRRLSCRRKQRASRRSTRSSWGTSPSRCAAPRVRRASEDLFVFPAISPGEDGYEISGAAFAMKPRSKGTVRLNDSDPRTPLAIDHGLLSDPHDAEVLAEAFEALRELAASEPVALLCRDGDPTRPGGDRRGARARGGARLLPSGRNMRDRLGGRPSRTRPRL